MRRAARGFGLLARVITLVTGLIAALIVIAILFRVFEANSANDIVSWVTDAARTLVGPFDRLFTPRNEKVEIAVNWGIAAVLWVAAGRVIAGLIRRVG